MRRVVMDGTREFPSVQDAAKYIVAQGAGKLTTVGGNISHVATRGRGTAYGHVWTYPDGKRDLVDVVRCRDCKYYVKDPDPIDPGWPMMCERTGDDMVEPYGFCWRGERKEGGDG